MKKRMNAKGKDGENEIENKGTEEEFKDEEVKNQRLMKEMQMKQKVRGEENCQVHQESELVTNENTIKTPITSSNLCRNRAVSQSC